MRIKRLALLVLIVILMIPGKANSEENNRRKIVELLKKFIRRELQYDLIQQPFLGNEKYTEFFFSDRFFSPQKANESPFEFVVFQPDSLFKKLKDKLFIVKRNHVYKIYKDKYGDFKIINFAYNYKHMAEKYNIIPEENKIVVTISNITDYINTFLFWIGDSPKKGVNEFIVTDEGQLSKVLSVMKARQLEIPKKIKIILPDKLTKIEKINLKDKGIYFKVNCVLYFKGFEHGLYNDLFKCKFIIAENGEILQFIPKPLK